MSSFYDKLVALHSGWLVKPIQSKRINYEGEDEDQSDCCDDGQRDDHDDGQDEFMMITVIMANVKDHDDGQEYGHDCHMVRMMTIMKVKIKTMIIVVTKAKMMVMTGQGQ